MKEYDVKFEIFDKKLKVKVKAVDEMDALEYVKNALKIHSIVPIEPNNHKKKSAVPPHNGTTNDWKKYLDDLFGGLGKL